MSHGLSFGAAGGAAFRLLLWTALAGCLWAALPEALSPAAAAAEEGGGVEGLNPLKSWKEDLAIWTAVVFVVLLAVLWRYAWGPIVQGLQKREQAIAGQIAQAGRQNEEARRLLAQYEQKLAESGDEVRRMIDEARREAEEAGRRIVDKAREDAEAERRKALLEIDAAAAGALKDLSGHAAALAVELAGKVLGAELKAADHARLIDLAVSEFPKAKAASGKN